MAARTFWTMRATRMGVINMQDTAALYGFLTVGTMMAITPGPNMLYVISRSMAQGRRAGLISLGGVLIGYLFYMLGAAFGITAFFQTLPYAARVLGRGARHIWPILAGMPSGREVSHPCRFADSCRRKARASCL
jgi:hypothetical protein